MVEAVRMVPMQVQLLCLFTPCR